MEVNNIFLYAKSGRLSKTAVMEAGLKNFKENFSRAIFRKDLHPGPALAALGQIFAVSGDFSNGHLLTFL